MSHKAKPFISYSRRNTPFTERLVEAFKTQGYDPWIDWEDIPYSADWWHEICQAIDSSDVVIHIVSFDSLTSRICNDEIDYARQQNKRIIPLIVEPIDIKQVVGELYDKPYETLARENWKYVRTLNWVHFYRPEDDFNLRFSNILDAIEVDYSSVYVHSRLLVRAQEWKQNNQGHGFLLKGEELEEAERWLASFRSDTSLQPTQLHHEYIRVSREIQDAELERIASMQRQTRRLQRASLGFIVTAVILIGGILYSLYQQQRLTTDLLAQQSSIQTESAAAVSTERFVREESSLTQQAVIAAIDLRLQEAEALRLAVEAQNTLDNGDPSQLAVPLALSAHRVMTRGEPPVRVQRVLAEAAYRPGLVQFLSLDGTTPEAHTDAVSVVMYQPNGTLAASGGLDRTVRLWDTDSGALHATLNQSSRVTSLTFDPSGTLLLVGDAEGRIVLWDVTTREVLRTFDRHGGRVTGLAFRPDGEQFVSGGTDTDLIVWETASGERLRTLGTHSNRITAIAYHPNEPIFVSADASGALYIWDANTSFWKRNEIRHTRAITQVTFNTDGSRMLTSGLDGRFLLWTNLENGSFSEFELPNTPELSDITFLDANRALIGLTSGALVVWDFSQMAVQATLQPNNQVAILNRISLSLDRRYALAAYDNRRILLWEVDHGAIERRDSVTQLPVQSAVVSGESQLFSREAGGKLVLWNTADGNLQIFEEATLGISGTVFFPDGAHALTQLTADGTAARVAVPSGEVVQRYDGLGILTADTVFSHDGRLALSTRQSVALGGVPSSGAAYMLWNTETGEVISTLERIGFTASNSAQQYAFNADGTRLAGVGLNNRILVVSTTNGALLQSFQRDRAISTLVYSPVDDTLGVGYSDGTIALLLENSQDWREIRGHDGGVVDMVFTANGAQAITVGQDNVVIVWDVLKGEITRRLQTSTRGLDRVVLMNGGFATLSADGTGIYWRLDNTATLLEWVRENRFVRAFSNSECQAYQIPNPCNPS